MNINSQHEIFLLFLPYWPLEDPFIMHLHCWCSQLEQFGVKYHIDTWTGGAANLLVDDHSTSWATATRNKKNASDQYQKHKHCVTMKTTKCLDKPVQSWSVTLFACEHLHTRYCRYLFVFSIYYFICPQKWAYSIKIYHWEALKMQKLHGTIEMIYMRNYLSSLYIRVN